MGGETVAEPASVISASGLSPRGRGNRSTVTSLAKVEWSIPAWAGKPTTKSAALITATVYPRVGGETTADVAQEVLRMGLSPRGRGNPP